MSRQGSDHPHHIELKGGYKQFATTQIFLSHLELPRYYHSLTRAILVYKTNRQLNYISTKTMRTDGSDGLLMSWRTISTLALLARKRNRRHPSHVVLIERETMQRTSFQRNRNQIPPKQRDDRSSLGPDLLNSVDE
jgi:hypothetical protein